VAFTFDGSCGFLKSASAPTAYRWVAYEAIQRVVGAECSRRVHEMIQQTSCKAWHARLRSAVEQHHFAAK
jgi:hypothetical protein